MRLIVIRESGDGKEAVKTGMLEYALTTNPLRRVVLSGTAHPWGAAPGGRGLSGLVGQAAKGDSLWAVPQDWRGRLTTVTGLDIRYASAGNLDPGQLRNVHRQPWLVISNGRFAAHINGPLLEQVLTESQADALAVTATPDLLAYRERIRMAEQGDLVGYRRLYRDAVEPIPVPHNWPHHFFIRKECIDAVLEEGLPREFGDVMKRCQARHLNVRAIAIAGSVVDLDTPAGLLSLLEMTLKQVQFADVAKNAALGRCVYTTDGDDRISPEARFVGPVLIGSDVSVEPGAVIIGPSILCDHSTVRKDATVDSCILGVRAVVEPNQTVGRLFIGASDRALPVTCPLADRSTEDDPVLISSHESSVFRAWPRLSYARCLKRIVDVFAAVVVLILFIPIIPLIALAVKLSSPGPVFFKDKRQGYHGRLFNCIKFRTMRVGAAEIQDKLRFVCEVDGPQFKIADDPRISTVGWFLRETYLDEIPQFINVLCGQMSIVGPRPSPESENTLCPSWRDARLSVRPGITGLWQVNRTRRPFKDFQEWIQFDTQYVQQLSPQMDLWICWCTFRKMLDNFIHQF